MNNLRHPLSQESRHLGITLVVIAHRLSTIRHCNRVIYLRDGHVAADGTYDELAALGLINGVAREAGCPMPKLEMLEAELRFLEAAL